MLESEAAERASQPSHNYSAEKSRSIYFGLYLVILTVFSIHLYHTPDYVPDLIQYMGNALLTAETNAFQLHGRVYSELRRDVPKGKIERLLGTAVDASEEYNYPLRERAANSSRFGEFLPLFAIRPLYNQTLYLVSKTDIGLVKSDVLISVGSYFLLGVLLFLWLRNHTSPLLAVAVSALTMMSPPLAELGRITTADALASLIAFAALYLVFEHRRLAPGLLLLLASIYFRTDFVVLAGPVLLICFLQRKILFWQACVLSALAVGSVLFINHFAGDYGIRMLYYRNFVGTPIAPAEMVVHFTARDYLSAFRSGITKIFASYFLPFLLVGVLALRSKQMLPLLGATVGYVLLHFLILPNWQERWVGIVYLSMVIGAVLSGTGAATFEEVRLSERSQTDQ
jgi:hypothetical protein